MLQLLNTDQLFRWGSLGETLYMFACTITATYRIQPTFSWRPAVDETGNNGPHVGQFSALPVDTNIDTTSCLNLVFLFV